MGDDPACKSSTLPSRSEPVLAALGLPVLYPGTMQDIVDLCRHGIELSRACGLWVALKVVTPVADGTGLASGRPRPAAARDPGARARRPALDADAHRRHRPALHVGDGGARCSAPAWRWPWPYLAANGLNRLVVDGPSPWLGIVAGGHTCELVLEALGVLGVDRDTAADARPAHPQARRPPSPRPRRRPAAGRCGRHRARRGGQAALPRSARPRRALRLDQRARRGRQARRRSALPLVPLAGAVTAEGLVEPLRRLLGRTGAAGAPARRPGQSASSPSPSPPRPLRTPFFCSGCPHNTSTKVPEGALVGAGIGCHGMITLMGAEGRGEIIGITQMGGEGTQWIGIAPFVDDPHLFQNLGDGTYCHSGSLAVQAAIAAGVTMTFKLLYNAAVAMTGGQDATGQLPVPQIATKLVAEGVKRGDHHHRRAGSLPRRQAARTHQGVAPRPHHRGPGAPADGARRDGAHPRPAVRGREAARPQARACCPRPSTGS